MKKLYEGASLLSAIFYLIVVASGFIIGTQSHHQNQKKKTKEENKHEKERQKLQQSYKREIQELEDQRRRDQEKLNYYYDSDRIYWHDYDPITDCVGPPPKVNP